MRLPAPFLVLHLDITTLIVSFRDSAKVGIGPNQAQRVSRNPSFPRHVFRQGVFQGSCIQRRSWALAHLR